MTSIFAAVHPTPAVASALDVATRAIATCADLESAVDGIGECVQLTPGVLSGFASAIDLGAIRVAEHALSQGVELRFERDPRIITVGFLIEGRRAIASSEPWTSDLVYVAPGSNVEVSTLHSSHIVWLRLLIDDLPVAMREALAVMQRPLLADAAIFADVRRCVERMLRTRGSQLRAELQRVLVIALDRVRTLAKADAARTSRSLSLVHSVEAFMWENVEEPLTLERICKELNCGVRALIYAFKDVYGIGPMTYWKARRLNCAHRKLRASLGKTPILEIAADFGFWHMGHFSSDHKHMFGMTPSQAIEAGRAM